MAEALSTRIDIRAPNAEADRVWSLHQLELRESLVAPYRAVATVGTVAAGATAPVTFDLLGCRVNIVIDQGAAGLRDVAGVILDATYVRTFRAVAFFRLTIGPALALCSRGAQKRIFEDQSVTEILQAATAETLARFGGSLRLDRLTRVYEPRDYTVQWGESDLDFILRILSEEGIFLQFLHGTEEEHLVVLDSTTALGPLAPDDDHDTAPTVIPFDPSAQLDEPAITQFEVTRTVVEQRHRAGEWDWKSAEPAIFAGNAVVEEPAAFGHRHHDQAQRLHEAASGDGPHLDGTRRIAELAQARSLVAARGGRGRSSVAQLCPGATFEILGHPSLEVDRAYYVTEAVHYFESAGSGDPNDPGAVHYSNEFRCGPLDTPFCPPVRPRPVVHGPETAVVCAEAGDDAMPDAHGRVRVQFHWPDREHRSCRLRVAQAWAGPGYGAMFLPRAGMEVIVSFLGGHPERPIITGCVYNGKNTPPYPLPEERTKSTIKTASFPGGDGFNELRFDDADGREQIFVHAQRRLDIRTRGSSYETTAGNREIRVGSERGGDLNALVTHDFNLHVQQDAYGYIDRDVHRIVDGEQYSRSQENVRVWVGKQHHLAAVDALTEVEGVISHRATEVLTEGTHEVSLKGANLHLEASHKLCLKCGNNYITIDPFLGIFIQGNLTSINSGGPVEPAKPAQALDGFEVLKPLDAYPASTGALRRPGSGGGGSGRRRSHDPVPVEPHRPKPPPPGPFPPPPPPPPPGPEVPSVDPNCKIRTLVLLCDHGRRGDAGLLCVVPDHDRDGITAHASTDGEGAERIQWRVSGVTTDLEPGPATAFHVFSFASPPLWPPPTREGDFVRDFRVTASLDGSSRSTIARCYPSGRIDKTFAFDFAKKVNGILQAVLSNEHIQFLTSIFVDDLVFNPIGEDDKVSVKLGFREDEHGHEAFFGYDIVLLGHARIGCTVELGVKKLKNLGKTLIRLLKRCGKLGSKLARWLPNFEDLPLQGGLAVHLKCNATVDTGWHRDSPSDMRLVKPKEGSRCELKISLGITGHLEIKSSSDEDAFSLLKTKLTTTMHFVCSTMPTLTDDELYIDGNCRFAGMTLDAASIDLPFMDEQDALAGRHADDPLYLIDPAKEGLAIRIDLTPIVDQIKALRA